MKKENLNLQLMESKLAEWRTKIEELEAKAQLTEQEDESDIEQQFDFLRNRYQDLEDHLAQLKTGGKEAAPEGNDGVEQHWNDFIQAFERLAEKFQ